MTRIEPVRYEDGGAMLLAGLRRPHTFAGAAESIPAQWAEFARLGPVPGQVGATRYGVIGGSDPERETFEYMCAAEVAAFDPASPLGRMRIHPQRYAVFEHHGHVSGLAKVWEAIFGDWLPRSGHESAQAPDFEVYGPGFDPLAGTGRVEIRVAIRLGG